MKPEGAVRLVIRPITLKEANKYVSKWHRHHKPSNRHRFSVSVCDLDGNVRGVTICARPVARMTDQYNTLEIARVATDGTPNACSKLYAACTQVAKVMGYQKVQTFILESEPGTSLKACGFVCEGPSSGGTWNRPSRGGRREDQPMEPKTRWARVLRD